MYIKVDDGITVFATHFISTILNEEQRIKLNYLQVESNGIVIYPDQNIVDIENILKELHLTYVIEELNHDLQHIEKSQNIKYASRSEAIDHLLNDKEPESQIIPNIKNNNLLAGQELVNKDLKILEIQNENKILGNNIINLELELLNLKSKVI